MDERATASDRAALGLILGGAALAILLYGTIRMFKLKRRLAHVRVVVGPPTKSNPSGIEVYPYEAETEGGAQVTWDIRNDHNSEKQVFIEQFELKAGGPDSHPLVGNANPRARVPRQARRPAAGRVKGHLLLGSRYKYSIRVLDGPTLDPEIIIVRGG